MSIRPANFTRRTEDLPAKFRGEGRWHLIPIYHLLQLSDFGREGIAHSGSYRFADHLYRNEPSGRGWTGRILDRILLNLPAARGMRSRCAQAKMEMRLALTATRSSRPFRILTVPCGIPRDVYQLAQASGSERIEYRGMDIDPVVIEAAREFLAGSNLQSPALVQGNALDISTWPSAKFDFISSTGLGEFLTDEELGVFYRNVYEALAPGGVFFTSATACEPRSDWLLRAFELDANYRSKSAVESLLLRFPWRSLAFTHDATGLQTFVRATR
jgi:SAM-dependent methyltransferase